MESEVGEFLIYQYKETQVSMKHSKRKGKEEEMWNYFSLLKNVISWHPVVFKPCALVNSSQSTKEYPTSLKHFVVDE